jgi:pimeloyl-ACP methyl ester carboxylesterase
MHNTHADTGQAAPRPLARRLRWLAAAVAGAVGVLATVAVGVASAADNPYQRGPDPTRDSVAASRGTFATATMTVPEGNGFTDGHIYYPTETSQGTFGAIAFVPGYNGSWDAMEWTGPWLASFGFVVIGFEAINPSDGDTARGTALLAALDYLTQRSAVRDRIDTSRQAVIGHSMGGGGAMSAASRRPSLKTAVGLAPAIFSTNMTTMRVPAMLMAGQNDSTVTPSYTKNFYNQIPAATEKAYVELTGAGHGFPSWTPNSVMMRKIIPWLKIFVDHDTRYSQFLCPLMDSTGISAYQGTCPLEPGTPPGSPSPSVSPTVSSPAPSPLVSGATYKIKSVASGGYLDSDANGVLSVASAASYDDQDWVATQQSNGSWTIRNVRSGRYYLDTESNNAVIWNDGYVGPDSQWRVEPVAGGLRLDNDRSDRGYLYGTSAGQVRWNTGSADASTVWAFERK